MHGLSNFVQLIPAGFLKLRVLCVQDKHTITCANFHAPETWISDNYVLLYRTKIGLSRHCGGECLVYLPRAAGRQPDLPARLIARRTYCKLPTHATASSTVTTQWAYYDTTGKDCGIL